MPNVSMTVNGKSVSGEVEGRTLLVQFLRDHLGLTGTHVGCDTGQCGACVVNVNGDSMKSCNMLAASADGATVKTIEGMANEDGSVAFDSAIRYLAGYEVGQHQTAYARANDGEDGGPMASFAQDARPQDGRQGGCQ